MWTTNIKKYDYFYIPIWSYIFLSLLYQNVEEKSTEIKININPIVIFFNTDSRGELCYDASIEVLKFDKKLRERRKRRLRIELFFELDHTELPKDNKSIWISFLKKVISSCNGGRFYNQYFSGTRSKDYTFSVILPKPRFENEKVILENNRVKMLFSADDRNKTGLIFFSAFIQAKHKKFPLPAGNAMVLKHICQVREQLITSSKVIFRTVTGGGLVVREHDRETNKDKYYTFQDEGFEKNLRNVLKVQAEEGGFSEYAAESVTLVPIQCKKVVVKQYHTYVDATVGTIQLEGNPDLLQYFYQAGLGSKHSFGYGMLDIVSQINQ